jgi:tryptophan-rich sensory protein
MAYENINFNKNHLVVKEGFFYFIDEVSNILYQKVFTSNAIPGWASSLTLILTGIMLQLFTVTLIVLLLQLSSRKNITVPNSKTYLDFIESIDYVQKS